MYNLLGLHDLVSGAILALLFVLTIKLQVKKEGVDYKSVLAFVFFVFSLFPTPFHGRQVLSILVLVMTYWIFYENYGKTREKEISYLSLTIVLALIFNVIIGLIIKGILF